MTRRIEVRPATVWQLLVDLDAWPCWGLTVSRAEMDGGFGQGSTGRVVTAVGVALPFEITEFESGRRWAWSVAGVPATKHGVDPEGDASRVWMSAPTWAPGYLPVLAVALRRIEAMAVSAR